MAPPEQDPDPAQGRHEARERAGSDVARERAMFPLGSPLLPGAVLPLHIFEPRYRDLARRCTSNDEPFGVVMIERGSEVGGGDVRSDVGCLASIAQHQELPDGRWVMLATGGPRIRIVEWLPDDPYPSAMTIIWPDGPSEVDSQTRRATVARLRRLRALASEIGALGVTAAESAAIDDRLAQLAEATTDATDWSFQLAALVPAGPFDRHAMLSAPDPADRVEVIAGVLDGVEELLGGR
ncbi:LON peptidase substrate-binding domain-containing protein [Candidatus Poriferisodalis sp.]|uniref:LON peptidase substrate-binding domain-containing protein n=1 Tax=Candidatus Poriferisodalis sp. TaxID=3101277 RepID=UPI003B517F7F